MPQGWAKCQREGHGCVKRRRVFGHAESIMLTGHSGQKPTIPVQHWIRLCRRFPLYPVTSSETTSFFPPRSPELGSKRGRPTKRPALEFKSGSAVDCLGFEHKPKRLKNACLPRRCWPIAGSAPHLYLLGIRGCRVRNFRYCRNRGYVRHCGNRRNLRHGRRSGNCWYSRDTCGARASPSLDASVCSARNSYSV